MRRRGFTLVELLVVIGIIALLISILMPALRRARDQANRIKCMSNIRSVMQGFIMYAGENKGSLPYSNWGGNPRGTPGWLYDNPNWNSGWNSPYPTEADGPSFMYMEDGAIYKMIKNREVFKCPIHTDRVSDGPTEKFTSYLFNGSAQDYNGPRPYRITKFHVMDVILYETGESSLMRRFRPAAPFNDGSSTPDELLSERHGGGGRNIATGRVIGNGGASVGCIDGHAEWMSYKDYEIELMKPVQRPGKSRLFISPVLPDGGWVPRRWL